MPGKIQRFAMCKRFAPALALAIVAVACSGCSTSTQPTAAQGDDQGGLQIAAASRKYLKVEPAGKDDEARGGVLPARVAFRPQAMAALGAPVSARVVSILVRPGETVAAGTPLLVLRSAEAAALQAGLAQAQAQAAAAEDALRRQNEMIARGVGLDVERFQAEMAAREARAELSRAQRAAELIGAGQGDRFTLRAPAAGVVLNIRANVGAMVSPEGESLVEIGDPDRLWVVAEVPEGGATGIQPGVAAHVRIPALDAQFDAVVDGVGQVVDEELRRLPVYLDIKGATGSLSPGMLAEVRLDQAAGDTALSLPVTAVLIKDGSRRVVYVERDDGRFEARPVRTGDSRDGRVAILDGLHAGDKVVMQGALLLDSAAEQLL